MKINDTLKNAGGLPSTAAPAAQGKGTEKAATAAVPTAPTAAPTESNVRLSSLSMQMQALAGGVSTGSVFNAKKVEEIKFSIANGNFQINSDKVADGLLATVRDLLHARQE